MKILVIVLSLSFGYTISSLADAETDFSSLRHQFESASSATLADVGHQNWYCYGAEVWGIGRILNSDLSFNLNQVSTLSEFNKAFKYDDFIVPAKMTAAVGDIDQNTVAARSDRGLQVVQTTKGLFSTTFDCSFHREEPCKPKLSFAGLSSLGSATSIRKLSSGDLILETSFYPWEPAQIAMAQTMHASIFLPEGYFATGYHLCKVRN